MPGLDLLARDLYCGLGSMELAVDHARGHTSAIFFFLQVPPCALLVPHARLLHRVQKGHGGNTCGKAGRSDANSADSFRYRTTGLHPSEHGSDAMPHHCRAHQTKATKQLGHSDFCEKKHARTACHCLRSTLCQPAPLPGTARAQGLEKRLHLEMHRRPWPHTTATLKPQALSKGRSKAPHEMAAEEVKQPASVKNPEDAHGKS